jgi:hypothetical protein
MEISIGPYIVQKGYQKYYYKNAFPHAQLSEMAGRNTLKRKEEKENGAHGQLGREAWCGLFYWA